MENRFRKIQQLPETADMRGLRSVTEESIEDMILVPGKLRTLFGAPNTLSINSENWFSYYLEADGHIFEVYGVSASTHIGGDSTEEGRRLADQLAALIAQCDAADYRWTSYYMDAEMQETFAVSGGKASYQTQQLDLSDEEFGKLYEKVYGLS